jgi:polyhydroxyalkanoate synthesis regulator phasin
MSNLFERSFLMALGAAMLARDAAGDVADELVKKGEETTEESRRLVNETVAQARESTRTLRDRFDESLERSLKEMGLVKKQQLEELELKMAQLEHRIALLEAEAAVALPPRPVAAAQPSRIPLSRVKSAEPAPEPSLPGGEPLATASEEYHHLREEEAELEARNPHLDIP